MKEFYCFSCDLHRPIEMQIKMGRYRTICRPCKKKRTKHKTTEISGGALTKPESKNQSGKVKGYTFGEGY